MRASKKERLLFCYNSFVPPADLILKNATVITMEGRQPAASMVAVARDKVLFVGGQDDIESVTGPKTKVIDCQGKTIVPGFNDAHCHIFSFVRKLLSIDVSPPDVTSFADIKTTIHQRAAQMPPGAWLSATGLNEFYLAEKRLPTRQEIDEAAPHHPVLIAHRSLHACVLNSLALKLAGITVETPDPPGGMVDRDLDTGEPNGILYEMLGYIREKVIPPPSDDELARGIRLANREYLANGITSLQDATSRNDFERWQNLKRLSESGQLSSRVTMMVGAAERARFQNYGLATGSGDNRLRLGAVKLMVTGTRGRLHPEQPELNNTALDAHQAGFQLAFHAVEPDAVEAAISALEFVAAKTSSKGRRHRIEHCAECPPHLLERLAGLPVVVASQPPFLYYSGERYMATLPNDRLAWMYRFRSLLDAGVTVAGSSDSPIVPNNPLVGIYAAVTRKAATGEPLLPAQAVSPQQALAMYTTNAAYVQFEEKTKGTIVPGKLADLVVLSDDLTHVPSEAIKDIKVEMTIIGGRVEWEGR